MSQNRGQLAWLDLLRLTSVILVMYGHLVMVGGFAPAVPGILSDDFKGPILSGATNGLDGLESILARVGTQTGILGVVLFFLITGYLMPMMMDRYSRLGFLVNRFFRIFPALLVSTLVLVAWLYVTQGITFTPLSVLSSVTLTNAFTGAVPVMTILWTLVIEVIFYACSALVGRFTFSKLVTLQAVLLMVILAGKEFPNYWTGLLSKPALFIMVICIGSSIYLFQKETDRLRKLAPIVLSVSLSYFSFQYYKLAIGSVGTYENFGTLFLALVLFLGFKSLGGAVQNLRFTVWVQKVADLVYPLYLFHAALGLSTMAYLRTYTNNPLLLLLAAVTLSFVFSWLIHVSVERPFMKVGKRVSFLLKVK